MTYSTNLQKRPLILPHEVREMRRDEQIIFAAAKPALRCGRAIFFRRPEMMEGLGKSRLREGAPPEPVAPLQDQSEDGVLHAAFDRLASSATLATTDDGAEATGFEGQNFDGQDFEQAPPETSRADATVATAIGAAAEAERASLEERVSADQAYRIEPDRSSRIDADQQPTTQPAGDLIATAEALFARRPIGRGRS